MNRCRSCRAPIRWARTERDRNIPLDAEPYTGPEPGGLFILRTLTRLRDPERGEHLVAVAVTAGAFDDEPRYRSHFATCPNADQHRRKEMHA